MPKKSFKENPALSFITQAIAENATAEASQDTDKHTHTATYDDVSVFESMPTATHVARPEPSPSSKKKPAAKDARPDTPPLVERGESKSKRLQLLLRPSTHDGISKLAKQYNTSVNDIINQVLESYLKQNT